MTRSDAGYREDRMRPLADCNHALPSFPRPRTAGKASEFTNQKRKALVKAMDRLEGSGRVLWAAGPRGGIGDSPRAPAYAPPDGAVARVGSAGSPRPRRHPAESAGDPCSRRRPTSPFTTSGGGRGAQYLPHPCWQGGACSGVRPNRPLSSLAPCGRPAPLRACGWVLSCVCLCSATSSGSSIPSAACRQTETPCQVNRWTGR